MSCFFCQALGPPPGLEEVLQNAHLQQHLATAQALAVWHLDGWFHETMRAGDVLPVLSKWMMENP